MTRLASINDIQAEWISGGSPNSKSKSKSKSKPDSPSVNAPIYINNVGFNFATAFANGDFSNAIIGSQSSGNLFLID